MSAIIAPTSLPTTGTAAAPAPVTLTTPPPIVGYNPSSDRLADYSTAFAALAPGATVGPVAVLTPPPGAVPKKSLSALEILLISTAVAVGTITLCLLISVQNRR
jgi:hypothetical protein